MHALGAQKTTTIFRMVSLVEFAVRFLSSFTKFGAKKILKIYYNSCFSKQDQVIAFLN
jgi:hypothetical protein